ncbi:hypothetical protein JTB14_035283 [Gonioctena quinquepunctata]|nr:hypothetical protein JTB14_035283 [Gonioctena quinquepunctata]
MDDLTFFKRFRLLKETVIRVLELIEEEIEYPNDLNNSVSPINQLLTTLRFYASSGHLATVADFMGIHESIASRIVSRLSRAIARLYPWFVKLPASQETLKIQRDFYDIAHFPRVVGAVDGTHIRIQSPGGEDAEIYRNRKGYFSLNTQVICDASLKLQDVVARWPGSAHDNTIFRNSRVCHKFEQQTFPNCVLLGDSGYAQKNYLLTPVVDPLTRGQTLYNESHIRTRNTVERTIGNWKRRFPVLAYGLCIRLDTVLAIIPATAVLHNIAKDMHEPEPPIPQELDYLINMGQVPDVYNGVAIHYQNQLVEQYFSTL